MHPTPAMSMSAVAERRRAARWLPLALLCASVTTSTSQRLENGPLTPDEALASFEIEPGYRIELAAAEPLVRDPVAIAFDERGRLYVVEIRGYPDPLDGSARVPRQGVVALLEDTDGDGRFDKRIEFARDLTYPNGIMVWNGGVFVTCAPDLLYLKDTNGDGVADERRVVLTGFDTTKTAQIRFSHPTLGLDNRVYLTGGLNGGRVTSPEHPERPPVEFTNSDSRFDPFTGALELTGGQGQFGLTFDDYGRRFVCSNRHPMQHVVLEPKYLKRNPHLAFSETVQDVSASLGQAVVWPVSADMTTASFIPTLMSAPHAGTFTAASGVHIHRGDALPVGHEGSIFICESAQNLVQRQVRSASGVTFTSRPARDGRDFLTSRDNWFRPVFAANGPDGALYIVDMYRKVIDHPQYVPEGSRALLDFEAGRELGRVYRVVARDRRIERRPIDLGRMSAAELSRTLEHPNAWWRETAQRLLVERRDRRAIPLVRDIAATARTAAARVHGLWTLDGLGGLEAGDITRALRDTDAAVRENALRLLSEQRVPASSELLTDVLRLVDNSDARVRLYAALTLGESNDARAIPALASIARRDGTDQWIRAAIFSSLRGRANEFLPAFVESPPSSRAVLAAVMQDLGQVFGAGEAQERCIDFIVRAAGTSTEFGWQPAALAGMAQGLRTRGFGRDGRSALMTLLATDSPQAATARERVAALLSRAAAAAADDSQPEDLRLSAIALLGHTDYSTAGKKLQALLGPRHTSEIQVAAVRALSQLPEPSAAADLVAAERWQTFTPQVREAVLATLMTEERHMVVLLDALDARAIAVTAVSPSRRTRLMTHRNAEIQARARERFAALTSGDRMQAYERLRPAVLAAAGSPARGEPLFDGRCASCHSFRGTGGRLGPDLSGLRNQPSDAILLHAIVPDYEISPGYEAYVIETRDGRTIFGRLESEAPNSVTLRDASYQQHVVLRSNVVSMSASTSSLMPNELERGLSDRDLADLIAFLKTGEPATREPANPRAANPRTASADQAPTYPGYALVWADEFNRDGDPDPKNWTFERGFVRNRELQWYQPQNARQTGGLLIIEGRREKVPNPGFQAGSTDWRGSREFAEYSSASLMTRGLHSWRYGRFEMRGRIDTRPGLWPAFWTLGLARPWPHNGEIDIMEYYRGMLLANAAWGGAKPFQPIWDDTRKPIDSFKQADWSREFHTWRMDWDERAIVLSVDGERLNDIDLTKTINQDGTGINPFHEPHYLLLNLAIGGTSGGDPSQTPFPARFEVDWVRVYQRSPAPGPVKGPAPRP